MPPSSRASTAGDHQAVWGSQIEQSQAAMLDTLLSMIPSVVFARATTFILGAAGYQVLDSPATSALKAACEDKPKAASVTLGTKSSDPWILTGPTAFSGKDFSRMGFKTFYSLTNSSDKKASLYLPFFVGTTQGKAGTLKINPTLSPLWKFPTRLVVNILDKDELECRMEWQGDHATCKQHNTAIWVTQDRYLNHTMKLSPEAVQASLPGLVLNAAFCRLNIAKESSGALWFAEQPENVTPSAPGLAYALTVTALPIFSSSNTSWSAKAWSSAAFFTPPSFEPNTRVDYLTILPKYTQDRHTEYLKSFRRGFDDVEGSDDWRVWAGLAYQVALPKEVAVGRCYQLSDQLWSFTTATVKIPSILSPVAAEGKGWPLFKTEDDALAVRSVLAYNIWKGLSVSAGLLQKGNIAGLDSSPIKRPFVTPGKTTPIVSLNYSFDGGHIQCAMEGLSRMATMAELKFATAASHVTLSLGVKWDRDGGAKKLSFGGGGSVEF